MGSRRVDESPSGGFTSDQARSRERRHGRRILTTAGSPSRFDDAATAWRAALWLAAGLTLLRLAALFSTNLELYPDEAQYWLWSRELHWGYVSKPPMIAWLIRATTQIGGDREAWVRASAPLLHAGAMLALFRAALRLYGARTALLAGTLYGLMPAVQVSALFITTDAPLMLFLALALWAYAALLQAPDGGRRWLIAAGLGAALGLAFLAKFAVAFFVIGMAIHAVIDRDARRMWRGWAWAAAFGALALTFGPNVIWQATHGFATVTHTTKVNAAWNPAALVHPGKLVEFVLGQLGVVGPIPLVVMIVGTVVPARRRTLTAEDRLLLCFTWPPVILVSIQAFVSRAHAHWAAAAYLSGVILAAAWLVRWRSRGWTIAALALQGVVALVLLAAIGVPSLVDAAGAGRRIARLRGWAETASIIAGAARAEATRGGLTAVAVEDRYLFNELAYYGRGELTGPGAPPLRMRPASGEALSEAELSAPLAGTEGSRVLIAETAGRPEVPALPGDFASAQTLGRWTVKLGGAKTREIDLSIGQGYRGPAAGKAPDQAASR